VQCGNYLCLYHNVKRGGNRFQAPGVQCIMGFYVHE
jgi:hypothetical protein